MRGFLPFFKKELLEQVRTGRLLFLVILFMLLGILAPAMAKLTPWLLEISAESLKEQGILVGEVTVTAMDAWVQFFKNMPLAIIAMLVMFSGTFTTEYAKGTLIPLFTKGVSRRSVVIAKSAVLLLLLASLPITQRRQLS